MMKVKTIILVFLTQLFMLSASAYDTHVGSHKAPTSKTMESIDAILLNRPNLKVLDIGNSYTDDATALLPRIAAASGADLSDMCLYKAIRGGATFKNWYDRYYDNDNANYSISKVLGGIDANITTGSGIGNDGTLFREALTNEQWDIIIIHQYSLYAPYYEQWNTLTKGGYLSELLSLLKACQPQAAIGFLLVHSYWDEYGSNKENSSLERWRLIANSVEQLCKDYDISLVIPYGTAVENLRASSLNNEYDLTRDGTHCDNGLSRYAAACCYYESLIAPRSGISVLGNTSRYNASASSSQYPAVSVTDENAPVAQKAAVLAVQNWHECVNPEATEAQPLGVSLLDGDNYYNIKNKAVERLHYSRTYGNTNWQAWYVPFDLTLTSEVMEHFAFAKFAGTYTEEDGSFYITVVRLKEGDVVKANTPYCVQAKVADSKNPQVITQMDATLKAAAENSFYVLSAEKKITFWGNYTRRAVTAEDQNVYAMSGGQYSRQNMGNTLAPFRSFFTIEDREDNPYAAATPNPTEVKLMVLGEDDATDIRAIGQFDNLQTDKVETFDLTGRKVERQQMRKGIYIVNGKKVLVK